MKIIEKLLLIIGTVCIVLAIYFFKLLSLKEILFILVMITSFVYLQVLEFKEG